jgi:putative membrane protein
MIRKSVLFSTLLTFVFAGAAMAHDHEKDLADMTPEKLLQKLHKDNQKEIKLGQLAVERGNSQQIRDYGRMLMEDHQAADERLMQLAQQQNIEIKDMRGKKDDEAATAARTEGRDDRDEKYKEKAAKEKEEMERLKTLSGQEFDREFLRMMQEDHQKHVQMLEQIQQQGEMRELQPLLAQLIPTLQQHERRANELKQQLGAGQVGN